MALLKNIKYPNGTETNYHKISELKIIPSVRTLSKTEVVDGVETIIPDGTERCYQVGIIVRSYVSQDIREGSEYNYLSIKKYDATFGAEEIETVSIMALAYNALKDMPEFSGAEDI